MIPGTTPAKAAFVVAIDGPAGAGKSTVALHLARRFGLLNLETGAMYRALALKAIRSDIPVQDGAAVLTLTQNTDIRLEPTEDGNRVLLDGADVTGDLRAAEVTAAASQLSVHGPVREWMVSLQRELGRSAGQGLVMEGRDIGTVVFPNSQVKLFLDASPEARGDRRLHQQGGDAAARETLIREMRDRDGRDRTRQQSPLVPAADAIRIDTTALSLQEVLAKTEEIVSDRLRRTSGT